MRMEKSLAAMGGGGGLKRAGVNCILYMGPIVYCLLYVLCDELAKRSRNGTAHITSHRWTSSRFSKWQGDVVKATCGGQPLNCHSW